MRPCVIFDLDGTLADTSGDLLAAANHCFAALGHGALLGLPDDAAVALTGGRAMLRLGFSRLGQVDEALVDAQYPHLLAAYADAIAVHSRMYDGAMDAVETLRLRGFAVGIATNKPERLADLLLRQLGVRDAFASLIGADTLPVRKPDPAHHIAAVRAAGGDVARSILVGDTITDRDTARRAGVPVVLVGFGPAQAQIAALQPDAILHDYADLPDIAARLTMGD